MKGITFVDKVGTNKAIHCGMIIMVITMVVTAGFSAVLVFLFGFLWQFTHCIYVIHSMRTNHIIVEKWYHSLSYIWYILSKVLLTNNTTRKHIPQARNMVLRLWTDPHDGSNNLHDFPIAIKDRNPWFRKTHIDHRIANQKMQPCLPFI